MSLLLDLTLELREIIIEFALCAHRTPPANPSAESQERVLLADIKYWGRQPGPRYVRYLQEEEGTVNSLPLLLVNRQFSAETKSVLDRLRPRMPYAVDVMLVNQHQLWPTWISVPALQRRVDSVTATFRIFGFPEKKFDFLRGGDGGPTESVWLFYCLLERFLRCGPVGVCKSQLQDREITVGTLTVDILTPSETELVAPPEITYDDWSRSRLRSGRVNGIDLSQRLMRPEWLVTFLMEYLQALLNMGFHMANYGRFLYERIGTIRICMDGKLLKQVNLDERLAELRYDHPEDTFGHVYILGERLPAFWRWKLSALEKRRNAGLPVIYPEDPELETA